MKRIRVGIFGGGRGVDLARYMLLLDVEIVALCENHKERREEALKKVDKSVVAY
jgi:predicted dehydrogenase